MIDKNTRSRNVSLISYLHNTTDIVTRILEKPNVKHYAVVLHDKDILEDGTPKQSHHHIALILKTNCFLHQVVQWFEGFEADDVTPINCFGQATKSNKAIIEYFTHKNNPSKFQYADDVVISDNIEKFKINATEDKTICILEDLAGRRPIRELVKLYGRDFVIHYNQYKILSEMLRDEDYQEMLAKWK